MKISEKIRTGILMLIILFLISVLCTGNKAISSVKHKTNEPEKYMPFMYYNAETEQIFAKGYDSFTYGLDSCIHIVNVAKGENKLYFVLYDMSIEFVITKYKE